MLSFRQAAPVIFLLASLARPALACISFGVDFQNGGNYFINSNDDTDFTAVSTFETCTGTADVILIAPAPDETSYECTDVTVQPDVSPMLSDCPILKSQMYNGTWSLVILANNGDNDSYAGVRSFNLVVAPQVTVTYTPTVTSTDVLTPITTSTSTSTEVDTTTLAPVTVTTVKTARRTITVVPSRVTVWSTITLTRTITSRTYTDSIIYATKAAKCSIPPKQAHPDPYPAQALLAIAQSAASSSGAEATATPTATANPTATVAKRSRAFFKRDFQLSPEQVTRIRSKARVMRKRAPDMATLTITDTNTADWITTTTTITTPLSTITAFTTIETTSTITPMPITYYSATTTITVTAATPTRTRTTRSTITSTVWKTITNKVTIMTETTPSAVAATCSAKGGMII